MLICFLENLTRRIGIFVDAVKIDCQLANSRQTSSQVSKEKKENESGETKKKSKD